MIDDRVTCLEINRWIHMFGILALAIMLGIGFNNISDRIDNIKRELYHYISLHKTRHDYPNKDKENKSKSTDDSDSEYTSISMQQSHAIPEH